MKKRQLIFLQILLAVFLVSPVVSAAPNVPIIDGNMTEWGTLSGPGYHEHEGNVGPSWDVEKIGLFINAGVLYIGLQADYDLVNGYNTGSSADIYNGNIGPGDFVFSFGNTAGASWDFAIDYSISGGDVSLTFHDNTISWDNAKFAHTDLPYQAGSSTDSQTFTNVGKYQKVTTSGAINNGHVIEAAVNLNELSANLVSLFGANDTLNVHWMMECGNDYIATQEKYDYSSVPEPATLLLFGMGLLGAGALGRRKVKKENV